MGGSTRIKNASGRRSIVIDLETASARRTRMLVICRHRSRDGDGGTDAVVAAGLGRDDQRDLDDQLCQSGRKRRLNAGLLDDNGADTVFFLRNWDADGRTACWLDSSRDLASFVLFSLPPAGAGDLPFFLSSQQVDDPWLARLDHGDNSSARRASWRGHTLTGIGYSAVGATLTLALASIPSLSLFCAS